MEVNKHINFLKRRGFLIKESSQMELSFDEPIGDGLNFNNMCANVGGEFCNLVRLAELVSDNPKLSIPLQESITKIYKKLLPPQGRNLSRFNRLVSVILKQKPDSAINTFKLISDIPLKSYAVLSELSTVNRKSITSVLA